jgi:predicted DNA-binding transcriptional regulator YafY
MTHPIICSAIRSKRVIQFSYHGGVRDVEPYCYGRSGESVELLRAYQLRGVSRSGESAGWKMFRVEELSGLSLTFETFTPRAEYDPADTVITFVNCRI